MKRLSGVAETISRVAVQTEQESIPHLLDEVVAGAHAGATPVHPSASGRDNGGHAADQRVTASQSSKEEHGLAAAREAEPEARRRRVVRAPPGRPRGRKGVVRRR
jgi:hypothetical protein